ncbi:MAG: type II toxin-antitoxin system RelE/ParE family toxin [Desulfobacterales bacterium]|nr:type II toxin-antitoxin system RelE/ParE family toxin [Desulfobacterales bacterium]
MEVKEYIDEAGKSPFAVWQDHLNARTAAKVSTALYRLEQGNFSNTKGIGGGIFEYKIDFGPGYRIYFGKDSKHIVIILGGGTKKRQQQDINTAKAYWRDYKARKRKK